MAAQLKVALGNWHLLSCQSRVTVTSCLYPRYEVYRGYIAFAFSVIMFVCLFVCLFVCKLFFPSKISQQLLELGF